MPTNPDRRLSHRTRRPLRLAAFVISSLLLGGLIACAPLSQPNPDQATWLVAPERSGPPHTRTANIALKMGNFSANTPYDGKSLVYRLSDNRFEKDFYNVYLIYPRDMVANATRQWLTQSRAFKQIVESSTVFFPVYQLQGIIDEFYGDYRGAQPEAVVSIQFYASASFSSQNPVFSAPRISKRVPLRDKSPQALIEGQQQALAEVLADLENRLVADAAYAPLLGKTGKK